MKTIKQALSAMLASAAMIMLPTAVLGETGFVTCVAQEKNDDAKEKITGVVKEKGEKEITLIMEPLHPKLTRTTVITVTSETRFVKAGVLSSLNDLKVGSRVKVTLRDDTREAERVKIYDEG